MDSVLIIEMTERFITLLAICSCTTSVKNIVSLLLLPLRMPLLLRQQSSQKLKVHRSCRRLGKTTDQHKSRKLLIHLRSKEAASSILRAAKKLRQSDNLAVSSSVYINPDRSPAESKLAFEMRQQRRKRLAKEASKNTN